MVTCSWVTLGEARGLAFLDSTHTYGEHPALRCRKALQELGQPLDNVEVDGQRGKVASPGLQGQGQAPHSTLQALGIRSQSCISTSCTGQVLYLAVSGFTHGNISAHVHVKIGVPLNNGQLCAGTSHAALEAHIIITQFHRRGTWGTEMLRGWGGAACVQTSAHSSRHTKLGLDCGTVPTYGTWGKEEASLWVMSFSSYNLVYRIQILTHPLYSSKQYSQNFITKF